MKTWKRPEAVGQKFVANEYVSACTITVSCDYTTGEQLYGGGLVVPESVEKFVGSEYRPCAEKFVVGVDELKECVFTHFTSGPEDMPLSKAYTAYYWIQDGNDFHATSVTADQIAEANMS